MTIEEAIQHCEEVAKEQESLWRVCPASENELFLCDGSKDCTTLANGKDKGCLKCAAEHRQLAEWLKDYKRLLEQEPKTGRWIDESPIAWKCSECYYIVNRPNNTLFCPNCGAKMVESEG